MPSRSDRVPIHELHDSDDALCDAAIRSSPPSKRKRNARSAPHSRTAFSATVSNTGASSKAERLITFSTSPVAVCRSSASVSSRLRASRSSSSRAFSPSYRAASRASLRSRRRRPATSLASGFRSASISARSWARVSRGMATRLSWPRAPDARAGGRRGPSPCRAPRPGAARDSSRPLENALDLRRSGAAVLGGRLLGRQDDDGISRHSACRRSSRTNSKPSISGIIRSSRISAGRPSRSALQRDPAVLGLDHAPAFPLQLRRSSAAEVGVVLDHEHAAGIASA